jgi:hypothetical protein
MGPASPAAKFHLPVIPLELPLRLRPVRNPPGPPLVQLLASNEHKLHRQEGYEDAQPRDLKRQFGQQAYENYRPAYPQDYYNEDK